MCYDVNSFLSYIVPHGGWLLEYYLWSCASWSVLEQYKIFLSLPDGDPGRVEVFDKILSACISKFVGWLLYHIASVGTQGRSQLFFPTFMNQYYGLSRDGIANNAKFGYGVTLDMFDKCRAYHKLYAEEFIVQKLQHPYVLWIDNFSKFHKHSIPSVMKDVFASCLWTGVTINEYTGPPVSTSIKYDGNGIIVPAMPDNLFQYQSNVVESLMACYDDGSLLFESSMVNKYRVNAVPLTINVLEYPEMKHSMEDEKNTTSFIHPYKLIKCNVGCNRGLVSILRTMQEDYKMQLNGVCTNYVTVNLDENIYYRVLKVIHCFLFHIH